MTSLSRTIEPVTDLSGQLLHHPRDFDRLRFDLVPGTDSGDLDATLLELSSAKGKLGQG